MWYTIRFHTLFLTCFNIESTLISQDPASKAEKDDASRVKSLSKEEEEKKTNEKKQQH